MHSSKNNRNRELVIFWGTWTVRLTFSFLFFFFSYFARLEFCLTDFLMSFSSWFDLTIVIWDLDCISHSTSLVHMGLFCDFNRSFVIYPAKKKKEKEKKRRIWLESWSIGGQTPHQYSISRHSPFCFCKYLRDFGIVRNQWNVLFFWEK